MDVIAREFIPEHFVMRQRIANVVQQPVRHHRPARERAVAHRVAAAQHREAQVIVAAIPVQD